MGDAGLQGGGGQTGDIESACRQQECVRGRGGGSQLLCTPLDRCGGIFCARDTVESQAGEVRAQPPCDVGDTGLWGRGGGGVRRGTGEGDRWGVDAPVYWWRAKARDERAGLLCTSLYGCSAAHDTVEGRQAK
mgnify:CR=1 FL=1